MEIQLQELIDRIKKDGIESASEEAARIKLEAESEAKRIVDAARKEAESLTACAMRDAERTEKASVAALEQASRNMLLVFKGEIQSLLDKLIAEDTASNFGVDTIKEVLPGILKSWASNDGKAVFDLHVSGPDHKKLQDWFISRLSAELKKGAELKSDKNLNAGFRIVNKDGSAYYDFSAKSAAELLSTCLSPRLAEVLKVSAKGL
jgi:V/A-type H+-transporting ATPase subunit E